jgi:hypothetical protein
MSIARRAAGDAGETDSQDAPVERSLSACEDAEGEELVWNAPDAELDQVLVSHDGES